MSVSNSATIVVGVRLSDIAAIGIVTEPVTRYHEQTGQPYQKQISREAVAILGVEVPGLDLAPSEWEKTLGLKVFDIGEGARRTDWSGGRRRTEYDLTAMVAGLAVVRARADSGEVVPIDQGKLSLAHVEAGGKLMDLATRLGADLDLAALIRKVRPFLVLSVSC